MAGKSVLAVLRMPRKWNASARARRVKRTNSASRSALRSPPARERAVFRAIRMTGTPWSSNWSRRAGCGHPTNRGDRGPGLSRARGRWRAGPASRQGQDADATAMALDQATAGGGAGDRTSERRLPVASLQAERRPRRCAARAWLRRRLQPALADALDRVFACLDLAILEQRAPITYHRWRLVLERGFSGTTGNAQPAFPPTANRHR